MERYDEMVEYMEQLVLHQSQDLTVEERNLLSVAYKNVIGAKRAAWRIVSSIEHKEETRGKDDRAQLSRGYKTKIETDLECTCQSILRLLDSRLVPGATDPERKVFYLKMKGDYHRYLAEFKISTARKVEAENTLNAYKAAMVIKLIINLIHFYHKLATIYRITDRFCHFTLQTLAINILGVIRCSLCFISQELF